MVTYEQPLNDPMRICLRFESLFAKIQHHIPSDHTVDHQIAMQSLLEVMNVIERPDLKSKLTQVLTLHSSHLKQLAERPGIDAARLTAYLDKIHNLTDALQSPHRIADRLRRNSFLSAMRGHLAKPGGLCHFHHPAYHLWLQQAAHVRREQLMQWYEAYHLLEAITQLLLQLSRAIRPTVEVTSEDGFFQQNLNPNHAWQLLQVILPDDQFIYPEISVGKHRVCIRLLEPDNLNESGQSTLVRTNLQFHLRCCYL